MYCKMKINYKVLIVAVHFMFLVYVVQFKAFLLFSLFKMSFWLESLQYPDRSSCERNESLLVFFFQVSGVRLVWGCSCWLRMLRAMWLDMRWCSLPWSPPPRRPCQVSSTPIEVTVHFQWRRLNANKLNYPSDLT